MPTNRRSTCFLGVVAASILVVAAPLNAADNPGHSPEKEDELLSVLRSGAPAAEKAITCKLLAIHGSSTAVPDLAPLLHDAQLASWARIALEAIPGPETDKALREATASLQGRLLVGTLNSIGVRQDEAAIELLTTHLQDEDPQIASAAAVALGRIGTAPAAESLRKSLATTPPDVRSAVAEGCVLCAERFLAEGKFTEAAELYDEVREAEVPKQRILEATRGAILARGEQQGIPLLLEQFGSPDKKLFQLALSTAREFPGGHVDEALAAELENAPPGRAALMIHAMADRPQSVVLPAVVRATQQGPKQVRLAAIEALQRVGDASCLAALLEIAIDADADLAQTSKATLAELPGEDIDARIIALLPGAEGKTFPLLIELIGQRRIDAAPALLEALDHPSKDVRSAALTALGETVALDGISVLVSQVITPRYSDDLLAAQQALKTAAIRMPDREACAAQLAAAIERSDSAPTKGTLLEILGAMGGPKALATIGSAARSADAQLQDVSSRLLGEWMTADAAPVLLDLTKTAPQDKYQVRALRGYIRIARQFVLPDQERAEMCGKALAAAQRPTEKKLVLEVLKRYPNTHSLEMAIDAAQHPELKNAATEATLVIAQKLGGKGVDVTELLAKGGLSKVKLEIVKAQYGAEATQQDVTAALRKQAGDLPLITLKSASYNTSFGGDPVPGTPKQLKIEYRINGKLGEASFAENAPIILPMP